MKDQLVNFETANLAQEKGFDEVCLDVYHNNKLYPRYNIDEENFINGKTTIQEELEITNSQIISTTNLKIVAVPTQSLLQKWLREKKDIIISVVPNHKKMYDYEILHNGLVNTDSKEYDTYEKALEQALVEGLKLIK